MFEGTKTVAISFDKMLNLVSIGPGEKRNDLHNMLTNLVC